MRRVLVSTCTALALVAAGCGGAGKSEAPAPPSKDRVANAFDVIARDFLEGRAEDVGAPMTVTCQRQADFDSCYASAKQADPRSDFGHVRLKVLGDDYYRVEVFPPEEYANVLQLVYYSTENKTGEEILQATNPLATGTTAGSSPSEHSTTVPAFSHTLPDDLVGGFEALANQQMGVLGKIVDCDENASNTVEVCLYGTRTKIEGGYKLVRVGPNCYRLSRTDADGVPTVTRRYSGHDFTQGSPFYDISSSDWHANNGFQVAGCASSNEGGQGTRSETVPAPNEESSKQTVLKTFSCPARPGTNEVHPPPGMSCATAIRVASLCALHRVDAPGWICVFRPYKTNGAVLAVVRRVGDPQKTITVYDGTWGE